jgi:hypothetical protein
MSGPVSDRGARYVPRNDKPVSGQVHIVSRDASGLERIAAARLVDVSSFGVEIEMESPLDKNLRVTVANLGDRDGPSERIAQVMHCRFFGQGIYRIGLAFETQEPPAKTRSPDVAAEQEKSPGEDTAAGDRAAEDREFRDYYEVLQVSPQAHPDTIQRVYQLLAQRYHPDNASTGSAELFHNLLEAYRVLSDPEQRAAYDTRYFEQKELRWQVFAGSADEGDDDYRIRMAILSALYLVRRTQPDEPGMLAGELESLLGCPPEHLEFSLWYLFQRGFISRAENGYLSITPDGVDASLDSGEPFEDDAVSVAGDGAADESAAD